MLFQRTCAQTAQLLPVPTSGDVTTYSCSSWEFETMPSSGLQRDLHSPAQTPTPPSQHTHTCLLLRIKPLKKIKNLKIEFCVPHMCECPEGPEEGVRSPGAEVTGHVSHLPNESWELNSCQARTLNCHAISPATNFDFLFLTNVHRPCEILKELV